MIFFCRELVLTNYKHRNCLIFYFVILARFSVIRLLRVKCILIYVSVCYAAKKKHKVDLHSGGISQANILNTKECSNINSKQEKRLVFAQTFAVMKC